MSKFEPKTFAQSMAEVAACLPVDEEAEGEILQFMRENGVENPVRLELPEPSRDEALSKHPCSERCWRIGQPADVPPGEPCPECWRPWPTKAHRTPPTAVRPALCNSRPEPVPYPLATKADEKKREFSELRGRMERILAAGGDHADALIGGLRVMLRDLEAAK